jgi:hypothetical protein
MVIRGWPEWWEWELELSPHLPETDGGSPVYGVDLRSMLEHARSLARDVVPGRWVVQARHRRRAWEVIVEPDPDLELVVVITAYPVDE